MNNIGLQEDARQLTSLMTGAMMVALIFKVQEILKIQHGVLVNLTLVVQESNVCISTGPLTSAGMIIPVL